MKINFLVSLLALAGAVAAAGCATPSVADREQNTARAKARMWQWIVEAKSQVTPADKIPVFFTEDSANPSRTTPPELWRNIFMGESSAAARLSIVEERSSMTYENFAFTQRAHYGVTVALKIHGKVHLLSGESDAGFLVGSSQLSREIFERALISVARQARVFLAEDVANPN